MADVISIKAYGGSDRLTVEQVTIPSPAADELLVRQTAVGVNYHDIYVRSGLYKTLSLPGVPGCEAAGVVTGLGSDVDGFKIGDRIAYVTGGYGAYTSERVLPAVLALKLPDAISDEVAAATLLRSMTVEMLTAQVCAIHAGMSILVHAAAGGVGRALCQVASHLGATVIGTVGSAEKAEIAQSCGCAHTVLYRETDFVEAVMSLTQGRGVDVVYDSVGADTFAGSIDVLTHCGHLVNFGQSSGPVEPLAMSTLAAKSLTVTRPILFHYLADTRQYQHMANQVFQKYESGVLQAQQPIPVALREAYRAHDILESMSGGGSLVLVPDL